MTWADYTKEELNTLLQSLELLFLDRTIVGKHEQAQIVKRLISDISEEIKHGQRQ